MFQISLGYYKCIKGMASALFGFGFGFGIGFSNSFGIGIIFNLVRALLDFV
jgi:hypothetical protein